MAFTIRFAPVRGYVKERRGQRFGGREGGVATFIDTNLAGDPGHPLSRVQKS